ncbi:SDR family oxidoreductase [Oceaniserpentilla sp. 4NH20-0058]|uniref:SDR family NAD(P)-dependent oxidoreductase n=1 Tax=Oceaniserpentilla sp. 4NH20-0058 TaxID=3127660 RepID=UPI00310B0682
MKDLFDVAGKVAVITGGSRGIGAMMAQGLLANGAKVYITARKEPELKAAQEQLGTLGECIAIRSDLSTNEGVAAFADEIKQREEKIDILINNAGATWGAAFEDFSEANWDKVMDLNVKSIFFLTQQLFPALKNAATYEDPARVINIASVNGLTHPGMQTYSYSSSKAAVIHLTKHLAVDLAKDNVNVNAIAPGFFPSNMTAFLANDQAMHDELTSNLPRGRMGDAKDAAGAAIYLSSRATAWMTGNTIVLDGGQVAAAGANDGGH